MEPRRGTEVMSQLNYEREIESQTYVTLEIERFGVG